ncbi:MAG: hypothetical protein JRF62_16590 [Deltaproteobacteria bacterium]|nr:hypothetical protein [Deltaproteobacteria bacterium]MBW2641509.1 hypothetical protein [Deltaproteobacteria bacterium]
MDFALCIKIHQKTYKNKMFRDSAGSHSQTIEQTGVCPIFHIKNNGKLPPRIHDLVRLANMANIEFDEETLEFLDAANTFT